jgi:hypothetical protein
MKQIASSILTAVLFSVILWGCATIMHGTSQNIGFSSNPTGAKVTVDGASVGVTPMFAKLSRKDEHIVKLELEGYEPAELTLTKGTSGWVWGNIVIGGLIGLAVDAISGGLYDLNPEQLNAELRKQGTSSIEKEGTIYLVTVMHPDEGWKRIGTLQKAP